MLAGHGMWKSEKIYKKMRKRFAILENGIILCIVTTLNHSKGDCVMNTIHFDTYISQFASEQVLSSEETVALHNLLKSGVESARAQLVRINMRLVVKIANDYKRYGMDFEDVVSNGVIGLLKAIDKFNPEKGAFSQYASAWINTCIREGFEKWRLIHTKRYDRMTAEERSASVVDSLNEKIGNGETEFANRLASDEASPSEVVEKASSIKAMQDAINNVLDAREQFIIRSRYGLDGLQELTLREIAEKFGLTHERVRQIEVTALLKIRRHMER